MKLTTHLCLAYSRNVSGSRTGGDDAVLKCTLQIIRYRLTRPNGINNRGSAELKVSTFKGSS